MSEIALVCTLCRYEVPVFAKLPIAIVGMSSHGRVVISEAPVHLTTCGGKTTYCLGPRALLPPAAARRVGALHSLFDVAPVGLGPCRPGNVRAGV
jgi:hypothetical protein